MNSYATLGSAGPTFQPATAGFSAEGLARITTALRADVDAQAIPGAVVLVVRDGAVAYFEAVGHADATSRRPMQRDSLFRIASMTKPLTVVAALMLMERGQLVLGDPVWRYIPEFRTLEVGVETLDAASGKRSLGLEPVRRAMTVHDLMRHTAGFTYGQFGNSLVQRAYRDAHLMDNRQTNAEMVAKLASLPLAYQPGSTFEYGMSTDVLGRVVEIITGRSLDGVLEELITGPLGMNSTGFGVASSQVHRLAEPRRDMPAGQQPALQPFDPAHPSRWFSGGGGLISCAADYAVFSQMLLNGGKFEGVRLLSRRSVAFMTANHLPPGIDYGPHTAELGIAAPLPRQGQGYGLGLGVRLEQGLGSAPGSPGDFCWGGALGPYFWADPAERLSVIFMLQELNVQRRTRYRALLRALVYQALT